MVSSPIVCHNCWPKRKTWIEPCPCVQANEQRFMAYSRVYAAAVRLFSDHGHRSCLLDIVPTELRGPGQPDLMCSCCGGRGRGEHHRNCAIGDLEAAVAAAKEHADGE